MRGDSQVISRYDAVSRSTVLVIPRYDAVSNGAVLVIPHLMRNPGVTANECLAFPFLDPASLCGVIRAVCGTYSVEFALNESPGLHGVIVGSLTSMPLVLSVML